MKLCPFCAEEIQDAAIVCRHCGRDLAGTGVGRVAVAPPAAKPRRNPLLVAATVIGVAVLGFFGLMIVIGILAAYSSQGSTRLSRELGSASYKMRAAELFEEYQKNEVAADGRYKGQVLEVSGLVKDIGNDIMNSPYVILGENVDNPIGTQALFAPSERDGVAELSKGSRVTVRCRGGGKMMNVILRDCTLR